MAMGEKIKRASFRAWMFWVLEWGKAYLQWLVLGAVLISWVSGQIGTSVLLWLVPVLLVLFLTKVQVDQATKASETAILRMRQSHRALAEIFNEVNTNPKIQLKTDEDGWIIGIDRTRGVGGIPAGTADPQPGVVTGDPPDGDPDS